MRLIKSLFLISVSLLIIVQIIMFNSEKNYLSEIDNRYLSELESLDADSIENYASDRIGLRDCFIKAYSSLNRTVFKELTHPQFMLGKDGEDIFLKIGNINEYDEYHEHFLQSVKRIQDYCEDRGIDFYFLFDVSKVNVYPERVSDGINYSGKWIKDFISRAEEYDINMIENYTYFNQIKEEESLFNKQYDVYHWNDNGAFLGINNYFRTISKKYPSFTQNDINDYEKTVSNYCYQLNSSYSIDEDVLEYKRDIPVNDVSESYRDGLSFRETFTDFYYYKNNNDNPDVLAFSGSYLLGDHTEKMIQFKADDYVVVHNYQNIFNPVYYINIFEPDIVLFEATDYTLYEYFFSEYYMEIMDLQPSLNSFDYPVIEDNEEIEYEIKEEGSKYYTLKLKNPEVDFDYIYLKIDDKVFDFYKYDNDYKEVTIMKKALTNENVSIEAVSAENNRIYSIPLHFSVNKD